MKIKNVAILGAGNGGLAAAADLSSKGYEIRLFELPIYFKNLQPIKEKGGLFIKKNDERYFVKLHLVTTDISEAIRGADLIMLVVPSFAIETFAEICAPHLEDNQIVMINGSGSMGSARFKKVVDSLGINVPIKLCETATLTYGTRKVGNMEVEIYLKAKKVLFSAYPSRYTDTLLKRCKELYESLEAASNVWEICLNNGNPESHPGPTLLNAGRIEFSGGNFYLYREGITESVARLIQAISGERKALCEALGINFIPIEKRLVRTGYCKPAEHLHQMYQESDVFRMIKGPEDLYSRYLTEDVSMGLVLWSSLGKTLGVSTPIIDSIIYLSGVLHGKDYWSEGMTLNKLGFSHLNSQELVKAVN